MPSGTSKSAKAQSAAEFLIYVDAIGGMVEVKALSAAEMSNVEVGSPMKKKMECNNDFT